MRFEDREGGVWIKAECPKLVPKSTRLVASSSSRGIWRKIALHSLTWMRCYRAFTISVAA